MKEKESSRIKQGGEKRGNEVISLLALGLYFVHSVSLPSSLFLARLTYTLVKKTWKHFDGHISLPGSLCLV